jgi:hypothetical protein
MADAEDFSLDDLTLLNEGTPDNPKPDTPAEDKPADPAPSQEQKEDAPAAEDKPAAQDAKPAAKPRSTSILDDADGEDAPAEGKADEKPGDKPVTADEDPKWREAFADKLLERLKDKLPADKLEGRRKAILNQLGRYRSSFDYMVSGFSAQERIRAGDLRSQLPADASDDEKAAWREENGLPAAPKDYDFPKVAGHKWTDADAPYIDSFKELAYAENMSQSQLNKAAAWYADTIAKQQAAYWETAQVTDAEDGDKMREILRAELGPADYKPTAALVRRFLEDPAMMGESARTAFTQARWTDANGVSHKLINDPDVLRIIIDAARNTYGDASFIRGDARTQSQNDIEEGERLMNTNIDEYWRGGWDKKIADAREALEAQSRGRRRAA